MSLSVVIPAYNEAKIIENTLQSIIGYFGSSLTEVIVVNNGSNDSSENVISAINDPRIKQITIKENVGKGFAVKKGIEAASGEWVLVTDADLSVRLDEYPKLEAYNNDYPVIISSRGLKDSKVDNNYFRNLLGKTGNLLIQLIIPGIKDSQCGFKLIKGDVAKALIEKQTLNGFGYDFELLFIAKKKGFKIKEVAVKWIKGPESKVRFWHYFVTLFELVAVIANNLRGKYN